MGDRMTLRLNNIDVACVIGERPDERTRLQRLRIDVELSVPDAAAESDSVADTVDYAALAETIRQALVEAKCMMIERAAKIVADLVPSASVKVTVTKYGAVPHLESASVSYERNDRR